MMCNSEQNKVYHTKTSNCCHTPHFSQLAIAMLLASSLSHAAEHPLTKVSFDEATKSNAVDLVMSIDWDINNPPAGRDKPFIENILKQTSQSLYTMTEGRIKIGRVSVYSNSQFLDNSDIQYLLKDGRANASISGFNTMKGATIQMFAGTNENEIDHGKTVAHELGHYLLGILDEYREEGKKSTDPGEPQDGDTPRDTIMNSHLQFETISTSDDYANAAQQNTAHFRVYKQSAWETILSPNGNEPAGYPKRAQLQALQGLIAPTLNSLTKPKTGWESALQVVYMGSATVAEPATPAPTGETTAPAETTPRSLTRYSGPIHLVMIDTTVTKPQLDAQINAAQQLVSNAENNVSIAVYTYPYANAPLIPLTVMSDATTKATVKTTLSTIALATADDDVTNGDRLFDWAETTLPQLFPAGTTRSKSDSGYYYRLYPTGQAVGVNNGRVYYYDGKAIADVGAVGDWLPKSRLDLSNSLRNTLRDAAIWRMPGDTVSVVLFSTGKETVSNEVAQEFSNADISINPVVLLTPDNATPRYTATRAGSVSLYDLAESTQGSFTETTKEAEWVRNALKVENDAQGDNLELIAEGASDALAEGASSETTALVAAKLDTTLIFQSFWEDVDAGKLNYTLIDPQGIVITPTTLPDGITYSNETGEGSASYQVAVTYPNHDGQWKSVITANQATQEAVFHEITTESSLFSEFNVVGGTEEDNRPLVAQLELKGPLAVTGADVHVAVYSAITGELVKDTLVFLDDGVAPDAKQGDGIYTLDLSGLSIGEYEMVGKVTNSKGTATLSTLGLRKKGTNQPDEVLPPFERATFLSFKKEL